MLAPATTMIASVMDTSQRQTRRLRARDRGRDAARCGASDDGEDGMGTRGCVSPGLLMREA